MWCMAWFMRTKLVPQHRETPVSSLKLLSCFFFCSWDKKKKTKKQLWPVQWAGRGAGSWHWRILPRSICLSLTDTHTRTHTETDTKYTHTYSGTTYILTSKHIYLICIDNFVIYHKTKQSPNITKHLQEFHYDWCVLSVDKVFLWGNVRTVEIKKPIIPVLSTLFMLIRHHHNCIFCDYHCVMTCQR